jgi:hypothetical protein
MQPQGSDPTPYHDHHQAGGEEEKQSRALKPDLTLPIPPGAPPTTNRRTNNHAPIFNRYSVVGSLIFSAMLVIVGSLQYCTYSRQAAIMNKQAKIMDKQASIALAANRQNEIVNRAFVYLNKINVMFLPNENDFDVEIEAVWGNSGNTPTTHLSQVVGCLPSKDVLNEPFDRIQWGPTSAATPNFYGPKTTENLGGMCNIPVAEIREINARTLHFYVCGLVRYGDTLDRSAEHRTEFCYKITGIDRNTNRFTGSTVGRHNCADEDCPQ